MGLRKKILEQFPVWYIHLYNWYVSSQEITYLSDQPDEFEGFLTNEYNNSIKPL